MKKYWVQVCAAVALMGMVGCADDDRGGVGRSGSETMPSETIRSTNGTSVTNGIQGSQSDRTRGASSQERTTPNN